MIKLEVCFSDSISATSKYGDATHERVTVNGWLVNYGSLDAGRLTMTWAYYDDIDYIPVDGVISSLTLGSVPHGDSTAFHIQANIPHTQNVCKMWLLLRKWTIGDGNIPSLNPYLADSCAIAIPIPIYEISTQPDPICQLSSNTLIGDLPISDYKYKWTPALHLLRDNTTQASFTFDYDTYDQWNDTTLVYLVDIQRPSFDNNITPGCISTDTVFVPLKGMPTVQELFNTTIQKLQDTTICSGSAYHIRFIDGNNSDTVNNKTTFTWTITNGPSVSMPASGTGDNITVAQVRNTGTQPVVLQVQVTPKKGNCFGVTQTYFITVNPKPRVNYIPAMTYCAGQLVPSYTITGDNSAAIYYWEFKNGTNILGSAGDVSLIPNFIANNNDTNSKSGDYFAYAIYENAGKTCYSDTVNFTMSIEPMPSVVLNPIGDRLLCSGDSLGVTFVPTPYTTTVSWQKTSGQNIPGLATNGTANPISLANIVNTGSNPIQAVYTVTPVSVSGRCMGGTDNFIIAINPYPLIQGLHDFTICSGDRFNYTLNSLVSGVSYTWKRIVNTSINTNDGGRIGTGALIDEILTSSDSVNTTVLYEVTLTANGCTQLDTLRITVKPQPKITSGLTPNGICSDSTFRYTPSVNVASTVVAWERIDNAAIAQPGNSGINLTQITQVLTNISTAPTTVIYRFSLSATGCTNEQDVRVVVQPRPTLSSTLTPAAICSGNTFNYTARSQSTGLTFSWTRIANANITSIPNVLSGTGNSISQVLTNTSTSPITVKYAVKMTANTCDAIDTVEVVVNPIPRIVSSATVDTICSGAYFVYNITSATPNTSFIWRRLGNSNISQAVTNGVTSLISEQLSVLDAVSTTQTVRYVVVSAANGCQNTGDTVLARVNPLPTLTVNPTTVQLAAGDTLTLGATTNALSGTGTLTWVSGNTGVVTVSTATPASVLNPKITAISQGTTYITVTATNSQGCMRSQQILVNVGAANVAAMSLTSGYASEICNGSSTSLSIDISGGTAPFTIIYRHQKGSGSWVYDTLPPSQASVRVSISPTTIATDYAAVTYNYELVKVTDSRGQNVGVLNTQVPIIVIPTVVVNAIANQSVCEGSVLSVPAFSVNASYGAVSYEWQNSNPAINLSLSGVGNLPSFTANNGSGAAMLATIQMRAVKTSGAAVCPGTWNNFTITVNPKPTFDVVTPDPICAGDTLVFASNLHTTNHIPSSGTTTIFYTNLACTNPVPANGVHPTVTTTYYVQDTVIATRCKSNVNSITLTVKPLPVLNSPTTATICSGDRLDYTITSNLSTGVSYNWARTAIHGIRNITSSGMGALIRETLEDTLNMPAPIIVPYRITLTADGCTTIDTLNVSVESKPRLNAVPTDLVQCSGQTFNFNINALVVPIGASYAWNRQYATGIDEAESQGNNTAISEPLTNNGYTPVIVRYDIETETGAGCTNTQQLRLTVGPNPTLSSNLYPSAICSGSAFTYTARSRTPNVIFMWRRQNNGSITPTPSSAWNSGNVITETLTNTSTIQQTVIYEIRMRYALNSTDTCENIEYVELQVNPTPSLTSLLTNDTICSGDYFSYTLTSLTPGVNYMWNRPRVTGISQQMGFGTTPYIAEMLTNTTQNRVTVQYSFTVEANGCTQSGLYKDVVVNPVPTINITNSTPVLLNVGGTDTLHAVSSSVITAWHWSSSNPSIVSITDGEYTANAAIMANGMGTATLYVEATNATGGCVGTASIIVNVGAAPTAVLALESGAANDICNGGSSMLEVIITGGTAPFRIILANDINGDLDTSIFYNTTAHILVSPPTNTGTSMMNVTYTLHEVSYGASHTVISSSGAAVLQVNPTVTISTALPNIVDCQGEVISGVSFASPTDPKVSYTWTNDNPNIGLAVNGSGPIPSFIAQNPLGNPTTANIEVTPTYRGTVSCPGTPKNYSITINPKPVYNVVNPAPICVGDTVTFTSANLSNVSPLGSTMEFFANYFCTDTVTAVYPSVTNTYFVKVVSPALCVGDIGEVLVTVKDRPQMTSSKSESVCSGERLEYTITTDINTGIYYNWSRASIAGINSGVAHSGNNSSIRENLTNSTNAPIAVKYIITMTSQGCPTTDTLTVWVYPKPVMTSVSAPNAICSGDTFHYVPATNIGSCNITWERLDVAGILEAPSGFSGLEGIMIHEVLTNTTANPIQVTYSITMEKDGCLSTQQVRVTVNPTPLISSNLADVHICSGATFTYVATSQTRNATFSWTRAAVGGNAANSGTNGDISEVLTNQGTTQIEAVYYITVSYMGCTSTDSIKVIVYPAVTITSILLPPDVCSEDYFNYTIQSNITNANYTWRRLANANIQQSITSGTDDEIYEQLSIRNTTLPVTVNYILRAEANGCMSANYTLSVIVNPKPTVQMVTATPLSLAVNNIDTVQGATNGVVRNWISSNTNVATVVPTISDPTYAVVTAVGQGIAQITLYVEDTNTGCLNEVSFVVNVEAAHTAVLTLASNAASEICSGSATTLEVTINGGRAPFTVVYTDGSNNDTLFNVGSSVYRFVVQPALNTTNSQQVTTYSLVDVIESGPQGVSVIPSNVNITVNPVAIVTTSFSSPYIYCEGDIVNNLPAFTSNALPSSRVSYRWQNSNPAIGLSMSGATSAIAGFVAANGQGIQINATITVTPTYQGLQTTCQGVDSAFQIIVNPKPDFTVVNPDAICYGDTVDLTANVNTYVQNIIPAGSTVNFYYDRACLTPILSGKVSPSVTTSYFVRLTSVAPALCNSAVKELIVTVKPLPQMTSAIAAAVCSGEQFEYNTTCDLTGVSYQWTRSAVTGITNASTTGYGSIIRETLVNATGSPVDVIYSIEMLSAGCHFVDTVTVTVNPVPVLNNIPAILTICSEDTFTYNNPSSNVLTADIHWSRYDNAQIAEPGTNGSGTIHEALTNLGTTPVTVTYEFTLSNAGCEKTELVRVVVNPTPTLSTALYAGGICSQNIFNYTARSATRGTAFTWERRADASITPAPTGVQASSVISEVLTNISANPIIVYYDITMTANGCQNSETVEVTVNPLPQLDPATLDTTYICSGDVFIFQLESQTQNTTYSWLRLGNVQIAEAPSFGNSLMISEKLTNRGNTQTTVSYKVISEANGCRNSGDTVRVSVNPLPQVSITSPTPVSLAVNNNRTATASIAPNTVAVWSSSNSNVATVTIDATDQTKALIHGVSQGLAYGNITITDTLTGCQNSVIFTINVDAEQVAQLLVPAGYVPQVCNGDSTLLSISMSGGQVPFAFEYTDGSTTFYDTAYQGNYSFVIFPPTNGTNAAITTTYTLLSVMDGSGQSLTVVGNPIIVTTNPVATVSNIVSLSDTVCEGILVRIPKFTTNVTPSVKVRYQWENDNPGTGLPLSGSGHLPVFEAKNGFGDTISSQITVEPIYVDILTCPGTVANMNIVIEAKPDFTVINPEPLCEGDSIDLNANTIDIVQGITPNNCTVKYFTQRTCATEVHTVAPTRTTTYYVQVTSPAACVGVVKELLVTINSVPAVDTLLDDTVCNLEGIGLTFTGNLPGTIFRWTKSGTINPDLVGLASSGTGSISAGHLRNNTANVQAQEITVTPELTSGGVTCIGNSLIFNIVVNPTPVLNSNVVLNPICSGDTLNHTPTTLTPNATIYWERELNTGIEEAPTTGTGNIYEALTNTTQSTVTVRYKVILDINGCTNEQFISVKVYPTPMLSSSLNAGFVCSGEYVTYIATTAVRNATFAWTRRPNTAIDEPIASGTSAMIYEQLTNNTASPVAVEYEITTVANGCAHTEVVTVVVGAKLGLTSTLAPADICSGDYFIYNATSSASVHYTWDREFNALIEPATNSGANARIAERLINNANTSQTIVYNITMTTNEGCQLTQQVQFDVHPLPVITVSESPITMAQGATRKIGVSEPTPANGSISTSNAAIVTATFDNIDTLTITANSSGAAMLTYSTFDANTCVNELEIPVTVTPGPLGTLNAIGMTTLCSQDSTELQITDIMYGKAPWTVEINYAGSLTAPVTVTVNSIMELPKMVTIHTPQNTTLAAQVFTYSITRITDSEGSHRESHIGRIAVTVAPEPTVDTIPDQEICNGGVTQPVYFSGAATTYQWSVNQNVGIDLYGEGGHIAATTVSHAQAVPVNAIITVTPVYAVGTHTCIGASPRTFTVTVNPLPHADLIPDLVVCYTDTVSIPLTGIAATDFDCDINSSIGLAAHSRITAGNNLTFVAQNITESPLTGEIFVTPVFVSPSGLECTGTVISFRVIINPIPNVTPTSDAFYCAETHVNSYTFSGDVPGASYRWNLIAGDTITSLPASGLNTMPAFIAYNTTDSIRRATYEIAASYTHSGVTCSVNKDTFVINVYPMPYVNPVSDFEYCAEVMADSILLGNANLHIYDWKQISGQNIGLTPAYGSGNVIPQFLTQNTGFAQRTAVFEVTPRIDGTACKGDPINFSVAVNPVALLSSQKYNDSICSNTFFDYEAQSVTANVMFSWERLPATGLTNPPATNSGNRIHEKLTSNVATPVDVAYQISLLYNGCIHLDTIYTVVKPTPSITLDTMIYIACQNDATVDITFSEDIAGLPLNYMYTFDNTAVSHGFINMLGYQPVTTTGTITVILPTNLPAGRYNGILYIESNNCMAQNSYPFVIQAVQQTTITKEPDSLLIMCEGYGVLQMGVQAIGSNLTYQWYKDGNMIAGATAAQYEVHLPTAADYGLYEVIVSGDCGDDTSRIVTVRKNGCNIIMKWDDVLMVSNTDQASGNLQFSAFQWYKMDANGDFIPIDKKGQSQYYQEKDGIDGVYMVEVFYVNGDHFKSCPFEYHKPPVPQEEALQPYPNPVKRGQSATVILGDDNMQAADLNQILIEIINANGEVVYSMTPKSNKAAVNMNVTPGVYVIKITKPDAPTSVHKLVVN
jgi:hypothetical protein